MEANDFDLSAYLRTEGLSDIGATGLGMQDARAGLDGYGFFLMADTGAQKCNARS